ncbi:hypothetical protein tloyanaT_17580 [Thalassotalea loyana]|jgi:hypothetical protein|uniref:Transcriptional regulator n=1 Tax=Thalassotalea loyana TaxID=280483 RepID=A0ABQ6HG74_9GAMM|nr:hypothetical protein [Thalassotalea loyana]GLX85506.1 hypothetical protein tloyanaT_17580 [Thalassotalea loyana]
MLHSCYEIKDIKLLLELNDSARHTLLTVLDQFDGSSEGVIDRTHMDDAEKQKLKRGISELKEKGLITKSEAPRGHFTLNSDIIIAKVTRNRDDHYLNSGLYRSDCHELLNILIAIEHFFDEFYNKPFVIKFRVYTNKPRIPATVFSNMVQFTEDNYRPRYNYRTSYGSVLNKFIHIAEYIKYYCDARQEILVLTNEEHANIVDVFRSKIVEGVSCYPTYRKPEAKALCKFIQEWFTDNYPEYTL